MSDFRQDVGLLKTLETTLGRRAYDVEEPWREGPMSSGSILLVSHATQVRVWADRGQWFVEIRPANGQSKWFDLEQWSACLGQPASFSVAARSMETKHVAEALAASWRLEPQLSWLGRHLDDVEEACMPQESPTILECLRLRGGRD